MRVSKACAFLWIEAMKLRHLIATGMVVLGFSAPAVAGLTGTYGCLFTKNYAGQIASTTGDTDAWAGGVLELDADAGTWTMHQMVVDGFETQSAKAYALDITGTITFTAADHPNEYAAIAKFTNNGGEVEVPWQIVSIAGGASLIGIFPYDPALGEVRSVTSTVACSKV